MLNSKSKSLKTIKFLSYLQSNCLRLAKRYIQRSMTQWIRDTKIPVKLAVALFNNLNGCGMMQHQSYHA